MGSVEIIGKSGTQYVITEGSSSGQLIISANPQGVNILQATTTSITDASGVVLAQHGQRHSRGGPDPTNWQLAQAVFVKTNLSVAVGTSSTLGSATTINPDSGYFAIIPHYIAVTVGGSLASGETITVKITFNASNGSSYSVEYQFTATGTTVYNLYQLLTGAGVPSGVQITSISVQAASNESSTSATVSVSIVGEEN